MLTNVTFEILLPKAVARSRDETLGHDRVLQIRPTGDRHGGIGKRCGDDGHGADAGFGVGPRPLSAQVRELGCRVLASVRSGLSRLISSRSAPPLTDSRRCGHVDGPAARPQAHSAAADRRQSGCLLAFHQVAGRRATRSSQIETAPTTSVPSCHRWSRKRTSVCAFASPRYTAVHATRLVAPVVVRHRSRRGWRCCSSRAPPQNYSADAVRRAPRLRKGGLLTAAQPAGGRRLGRCASREANVHDDSRTHCNHGGHRC